MAKIGRFSWLATCLLLSGCASAYNPAGQTTGQPDSPKAYQATYSSPSNFAYQTEKVYNDGAGHIRVDLIGQGPTVVNILDRNNNETIAWTDGVTQYIRRQSQPMDPLVMRVRALSMPRTEGALGAKEINGHKCHGFSMNGTEIWFDDDYNCEVVVTSGGITKTMTNFSPQPPDSSVFQPPPGYTQAATHGVMHHTR